MSEKKKTKKKNHLRAVPPPEAETSAESGGEDTLAEKIETSGEMHFAETLEDRPAVNEDDVGAGSGELTVEDLLSEEMLFVEESDEEEAAEIATDGDEPVAEGDAGISEEDHFLATNGQHRTLPDGQRTLFTEEPAADVSGSELDAFESAEIEDLDFLEDEQVESIIEGILFASDRPVSMAAIKLVFKGTNVRTDRIRRALDRLAVDMAGARRGVSLEEVVGGYQLRTKYDHIKFIKRNMKARSFKLSGPALEVLAIVAYKQPIVKSEMDEIRGVESGHLLRALMEKGLVQFEGKSELPGRPMQYATSRKFLEIFGLRNLKELPTLSQIDELIPEGISEEFEPERKSTLSDITDTMSQSITNSYSEGEDELSKIQNSLEKISTSSEFFEEEKRRQKAQKDKEKADGIREALLFNEVVTDRDKNWLKRYDEQLMAGNATPVLNEEGEVVPEATHVDAEAAHHAEQKMREEDSHLAEGIDFEEAPSDMEREFGDTPSADLEE